MVKKKRGISNIGRAAKDLGTSKHHLKIMMDNGLIPAEAYAPSKGKSRFHTKILSELSVAINQGYKEYCKNLPKTARKPSITKQKIAVNGDQQSLLSMERPKSVTTILEESKVVTKDKLDMLIENVNKIMVNQEKYEARLEHLIVVFTKAINVKYKENRAVLTQKDIHELEAAVTH